MQILKEIARLRTALLVPVVALVVGFSLGFASDQAVAKTDVKVEAEIFSLDGTEPDKTRFGDLEWRGGLILTSDDPRFGGFSGLVISPDGQRIIGVSDIGRWMTADLQHTDGQLTGLNNVNLSRILGAPGERLDGKVERDSEGLGIATNGDILVAFERYHRVARYDFTALGPKARATYIDLPEEISDFSTNKGFEAVGQFGEGTLHPGKILVIAERFLDSQGNHSGWLLGSDGAKRLSIKRSREFDITDLTILDDGRVIILERRFSLFSGVAMRMRIIAPEEFSSGEPIQGQTLLIAHNDLRIDNMEGLSAHTNPEGETILTLVSDNNFRDTQRTLIMQFALRPAD